MVYESSYESGRTPFVPDTKRGYWAQPSDFIYACLGLAFKMDIFSMAWFFFFEMGIYSIIPYIISLVVYVVPLFFVQAFLGQFSSSGFISSLRLSPLFKGMGYVSLALNVTVLMYIGIFAAVPLFFLFHSFRPTLPWSCEAFLVWIKVEQNERYSHNYCNLINLNDSTTTTTTSSSNSVALTNTTTTTNDVENYFSKPIQIPSVIFFRSQLTNFEFLVGHDFDLEWPWQLVFFMLVVWALIALFFYKIRDLEKISLFIRYSIWIIMALMLLCVVRFSFLEIGKRSFQNFFYPTWRTVTYGLEAIPVFVGTAFGSTWGLITSLSSYNKFQTNLMSCSWIICAGYAVITVLFGLAEFLIHEHYQEISAGNYLEKYIMYYSSGTVMANMRLANMWCILFFSALTLSGVLMIVVQLLAIFTAIFDDFEFLRMRKQEVKLGLIAFLALSSIYFCSNHGLLYSFSLSMDSIISHAALNLLMILVVLWIYGRERFQRDIEFMLGQQFASWCIFMLRFIAPIAMIITILFTLLNAYQSHLISSAFVGIIAVFVIVLPWIGVPGYAGFKMCQQTTGSFWERFKRCSRPTDWYPVEAYNRQRYEEAIGNMDITHQLNEVVDEML